MSPLPPKQEAQVFRVTFPVPTILSPNTLSIQLHTVWSPKLFLPPNVTLCIRASRQESTSASIQRVNNLSSIEVNLLPPPRESTSPPANATRRLRHLHLVHLPHQRIQRVASSHRPNRTHITYLFPVSTYVLHIRARRGCVDPSNLRIEFCIALCCTTHDCTRFRSHIAVTLLHTRQFTQVYILTYVTSLE